MNDGLILRSAKDLMSTETQISWSNKHALPPGYAWNEEGYVITTVPFPFVRACVGLRFAFLIGRIGMKEYIRQNLIVLRLLNGSVHKAIVTTVLYMAFKKAGYIIVREDYDKIANEVYELDSVPALDPSFITWRRTWFSSTCEYDTVSKVLRVENSCKIDADRELMTIDEKYITAAVAEFTGFSRRRIDSYWSERQWDRKLRALYTLEEAYTELEKTGIDSPTRLQLALMTGFSEKAVEAAIKDTEKMITTMGPKALNQ